MKYTAKGEHNKHFELLNTENNSLGRLDYTGWFSIKSDIVIGSDTWHIAPSNIWNTKIQVTKNEATIAELKYNWVGHMVIKLEDGQTYLFKPAFWHNKYSLLTEHEKEIIVLKPDFQWSKFSYNYEIETDDNYDEGKSALLVLILIYCCNQVHARGYASAAV
jgi:hypothetical protein